VFNVLLVKSFSFKGNKGEGAPLSFLYLSTALKKVGHNVKILDLSLKGKNDFEFLKDTVDSFNPQVIGFTCNTHERLAVIDLVNFVKKNNPDKLIVVGGPHVALLGKEMMISCPNIDIGVCADGEKAIVKITNDYNNYDKLKNIEGIYFRENNQIIKNETKEIIKDLDLYGHPDLDIIDLREYSLNLPIKEKPPAISICTSRGCPFRCSFCAATRVNYGQIRYHSASWIFDEVKKILSKYGDKYVIFFYDDHFLLNKDRVFQFCDLVEKNKLKFKWGCYSRVDIIDDEILARIKKVGCIMLTFGIESGSDKILNLMNKRTNHKMIIRAIRKVKDWGIYARGSFIWGYPGENWFDIIKTFWMIFKCDFDIGEVVFGRYVVIYPGTELVKYLPKRFDWHKKEDIKSKKQMVFVPVYVPMFDWLRRKYTFSLFFIYKIIKKLKGFWKP